MAEKFSPFDPAEMLSSEEEIAIYLDEALKTNDAAYVAHALGVVARAKGMKTVAAQTGLSREHLYRSCSASGNPTLKTLLAVLSAVGVELTTRPATAH
ncbi:addiction module antidote protein [Mitsuaria sp. GD03876]|uniref:addiction module antidote protein n=1 Tax=Mitsuaria sp. GD03876 TaxID=2975399 RepID=UPI002447B026|nr:addiction module antidote protein [Mitsuaria sp. GD03876]MDH0864129.1 putative addiction module antidote protein [Mitsuaria sp. GD03876]